MLGLAASPPCTLGRAPVLQARPPSPSAAAARRSSAIASLFSTDGNGRTRFGTTQNSDVCGFTVRKR
ncbi:hypothetical protein U9M48_002382 [Paspalum notatum var. saurae]|uniref:Uncharacterized protein n=1 Tax=Paspalum notatum var. saurae TaxID=547442 RepID=A0AAQ3PFZ1_PASNO